MINANFSERKFDVLSTDITNHCNARCIFCFNDWAKHRPNIMTEEVLSKTFCVYDLFRDSGVYFSCLFEPSIHPNFVEYVKLLPPIARQKAFFTSNFVKKMTDEELNDLVDSNIGHINISLETFNPETYSYITKVKESYFYDNIKRLSDISRKKGRKIIRFITMLIKSNYNEMMDLISNVQDNYYFIEHEIRTPFFFECDEEAQRVFESELLSRKQIEEITEKINALGKTNISFEGTMDLDTYNERKNDNKKTALEVNNTSIDNYTVRVDASGIGHFAYDTEKFDLNELDTKEIYNLFKNKLFDIQLKEAKGFDTPFKKVIYNDEPARFPVYLDESTVYDNRFLLLKGWEQYSTFTKISEENRFIVTKDCNNNYRIYSIRVEMRPDVVKAYDNPKFYNSGFFTLIDISDYPFGEIEVYIGIMRLLGKLIKKKTVFLHPVDTIKIN